MQDSKPLSQLLHDLNQPLSAINTYAQAGIQLLERGLDDPERLTQLFGKIAQQCERASLLGKEIGREFGTTNKDST